MRRVKPANGQAERVAAGKRNRVGGDIDPRSGDDWSTENARDWISDDLLGDKLNRIGKPFPADCSNNIFSAEHGSWNCHKYQGGSTLRVVTDAQGKNARPSVFATGSLDGVGAADVAQPGAERRVRSGAAERRGWNAAPRRAGSHAARRTPNAVHSQRSAGSANPNGVCGLGGYTGPKLQSLPSGPLRNASPQRFQETSA